MDISEQRRFLEQSHTAIITSLRRDGRPSAVPVWYVMVDGSMYIGTVPMAAKVGHLRRDPRCCVLVESGSAWHELRALQIQANAVLLEPGPETRAAETELERKYAAHRTSPEQMPRSAQQRYDETVWLRIDPVGEPVSWDNSKMRLRSSTS